MIGLLPFMAPVYAIIIAIVAYFGTRVFVGRQKKQIQKAIGEGICAICGARIIQNKCPICDETKAG